MIYVFCESECRDVVKIGLTDTLDGAVSLNAARKRLGSVQTGTWRPMVCIAVANGNREVERQLHDQFAEYHVRGEWFNRAGDVAAWVDANAIAPVTAAGTKIARNDNRYRGHTRDEGATRLSNGTVSGLGRCRLCREQGHTARNCPRLAKVIGDSIKVRHQKRSRVRRVTMVDRATSVVDADHVVDAIQTSLPIR